MPQVYTPRPRASVPSFARVPPQNLESEKAVLGSVMLRPEAIHEILESVSPESFYAEKHR
ncbi:MAG TPA: DnaB-like helicase N-terminal domain-containing protein, partial [Candidatus Paceibacterota bacterium]|nr:DnaB-like helicase N-terminal domain-containing protein [Candidatus Paceibacterota bacterium]